MAVAVNAPKTPVTEGSNAVAAATLPNVCKMPGPPAPFVPAPLPNIGKSNNSPQGYSTTVTIEGNAVAIQGATFNSMGDVASQGTGGGIVSSNVQGPTSFIAPGSMNVKIEGKNVQLLGDQMLNNGGPSGSPPNAATMGGALQAPAPPVIATAPSSKPATSLQAVVKAVTFESGIKLYVVESGGAETETPAAGTPHWDPGKTYPAVYVREGGTGETKTLKVNVEWNQVGADGSARLRGRSRDGSIVIEGNFNISGVRGNADVSCTFTKRPAVVANFERGVVLTWTVEAGGMTATAAGGSPLVLYFVDAKPKPIGWGYKAHYLQVVKWATSWAAGKTGEADVLAAIWSKFSTGKAARVPHATGFSYWKTGQPVQDLKTLLQPDGGVLTKGWSCRAIAHLFMECLAVHGIQCLEVVPNTAPATKMFLVHNWTVAKTTVPNWEAEPDLYYAGTWGPLSTPPLRKSAKTSLTRVAMTGSTKVPLKIDMEKKSGVPAQGQPNAPLGFSNHWIVQVGGTLYDTSYGLKHTNDMVAYAKTSLAGWVVDFVADGKASAWLAHEISAHTLIRRDGSSN